MTTDGRAQVTWQPGAVPDGSTVTLTPGERCAGAQGHGRRRRDLRHQHPPPLADRPDLRERAAGRIRAGVHARQHGLARAQHARRTDASSREHRRDVQRRDDAARHPRAADAHRGVRRRAWGDPSLVAEGLPTVYRNGQLTAKRLSDGEVVVRTRVTVASQAHLFVGLAGGVTKESLLLQPGSVPIVVRIRHLKAGVTAHLRVAAVDPFKRRAALLLAFRVP